MLPRLLILFLPSSATLSHPRVHAGVGEAGMDETAACEVPKITRFCGDQRLGDTGWSALGSERRNRGR